MFLLALLAQGCGERYRRAEAFNLNAESLSPAKMRNFDRNGEQVELKLIRWDDLDPDDTYAVDGESIRFRPIREAEAVPSTQRSLFGAGELAGVLAGLAIDTVREQLEKEAARHTQQFRSRLYDDEFWQSPGKPRYAGFELIRWTTAFPKPDDESTETRPPAAFRLVCAFEPAEHDRRMMMIRPVYLRVASAAAKTSNFLGSGHKIEVDTNIIMHAAYFSRKEGFIQRSVADASFKVTGYDLVSSPCLTATWDEDEESWRGPLASRYAGYFLAPPLPEVETEFTSNEQGGVFQLFVAVTEKDESRVQKDLLRFSEFVGENKANVVEFATQSADRAAPRGP